MLVPQVPTIPQPSPQPSHLPMGCAQSLLACRKRKADELKSPYQHFYAILDLQSSPFPFTNDVKANICNTLKTHKCFSFLLDPSNGGTAFIYFMTMYQYPLAMVQQKLALDKFISCSGDSAAVPWRVVESGGLAGGLDDDKLQTLVPIDILDDEKFMAERWTLTPLDSAQKFGVVSRVGAVVDSVLETDRMWDCYDRVLFELDSLKELQSNTLSRCFSMLFTTTTGKVSNEQTKYLTDTLSIFCAESVRINGIYHICMQLNESSTTRKIADHVHAWNKANPQDRITIIRQDGCFQPLQGNTFMTASFYVNCVFPRIHDSTRQIWC